MGLIPKFEYIQVKRIGDTTASSGGQGDKLDTHAKRRGIL